MKFKPWFLENMNFNFNIVKYKKYKTLVEVNKKNSIRDARTTQPREIFLAP